MRARQGKTLPTRTEPLPKTFAVQRGKSMLVLGLVLIVAFGGVTLRQVMAAGLAQSRELLIAGVFSVLAGAAVLLDYKNHRLLVDGDTLCYTGMFGSPIRFRADEIVSVRMDVTENPKLLAEDGRTLARVERSMENFDLLVYYLKEHAAIENV